MLRKTSNLSKNSLRNSLATWLCTRIIRSFTLWALYSFGEHNTDFSWRHPLPKLILHSHRPIGQSFQSSKYKKHPGSHMFDSWTKWGFYSSPIFGHVYQTQEEGGLFSRERELPRKGDWISHLSYRVCFIYWHHMSWFLNSSCLNIVY